MNDSSQIANTLPLNFRVGLVNANLVQKYNMLRSVDSGTWTKRTSKKQCHSKGNVFRCKTQRPLDL